MDAYKAAGCDPEFPFILASDGATAIAGLFDSPNSGGPTWVMHPDREYVKTSYSESALTSSINSALSDDCNNGNVTKYTLTVNKGTGSGDYEEGASVPVTANSAQSGYEFDTWTGDTQYVSSAGSESITVTMPAKNISITATYKEIIVVIDTVNPSANLLTWCDWGVLVDEYGSTVDTGSALIANDTAKAEFTITGSDSTKNEWAWGSLNAWLPEGDNNNLREVNYMKLVYRSTGSFQVSLPQPPLSDNGEAFMKSLPSTNGALDTILLKISDFDKPDWSSDTTPLDLTKVEAVTIEPVASYSGSTHSIEVGELILYNYQGDMVALSSTVTTSRSAVQVMALGNQLRLEMPTRANVSVNMYTPTGRQVFSADVHADNGTGMVTLPASIAGGYYLVNISGAGVDLTQGVILK